MLADKLWESSSSIIHQTSHPKISVVRLTTCVPLRLPATCAFLCYFNWWNFCWSSTTKPYSENWLIYDDDPFWLFRFVLRQTIYISFLDTFFLFLSQFFNWIIVQVSVDVFTPQSVVLSMTSIVKQWFTVQSCYYAFVLLFVSISLQPLLKIDVVAELITRCIEHLTIVVPEGF